MKRQMLATPNQKPLIRSNEVAIVVGFIAWMLLPAPAALGQGPPGGGGGPPSGGGAPQTGITNVTVNLDTGQMQIRGVNFGASPTVFLGNSLGSIDELAIVQPTTATEIVAVLSTTAPGTYLLVVEAGASSNQIAMMDVTFGVVVGCQGVAGPTGPMGPPGPAGTVALGLCPQGQFVRGFDPLGDIVCGGTDSAGLTIDFEAWEGSITDANVAMTIDGFDMTPISVGPDFGALVVIGPGHPAFTLGGWPSNGTAVLWSPRQSVRVENSSNAALDTFVLERIDIGLDDAFVGDSIEIEGFLGGLSTGVVTDTFTGYRTLSGVPLGTIDSFTMTGSDFRGGRFLADNIVVSASE